MPASSEARHTLFGNVSLCNSNGTSIPDLGAGGTGEIVMAFQRGRQAAEETAKAECLRRWPHLILQCRAVYHLQNYRIEGYVITKDDLSYGGRITVGTGRSASDAWQNCLANLSDD